MTTLGANGLTAPLMSPATAIAFDNSYARELEGLYTASPLQPVPAAKLLKLNLALAEELGLDTASLMASAGVQMLAAAQAPQGAAPLAQAYAGHQFGGFSPQLGDGRALLLGEVIDRHGHRRDIAFKGSGRTAYSRGGDGKAALGPVLREYLMGEAMHALGVPTTRALAVVGTGEWVRRERPLPGAVLTRVAASHVRVGTFQYFAARGEHEKLQRLLNHVIARHDPALRDHPLPALGLLQAVAERQAALIARWMHLGFIHGVMNTDNMTVSGETIDYGPCAFMERYDPAMVFSSIDHGGRYAYANQPLIARWNLARLAESLLPLMGADADVAVAQAVAVIDAFPARYEHHWLAGARAKLGLQDAQVDDLALAHDWLQLLHTQGADFTLAWRRLADVAEAFDRAGASHAFSADATVPLQALLADPGAAQPWLARWWQRLQSAQGPAGTPAARAAAMRQVSPIYIPRNARVEEALTAASEASDYSPFEQLLAAVCQPFEEHADRVRLAEPAAQSFNDSYQTFCGT
ncbi:protein adenylyltransferase SelO [Roseateles koreensis]|uniref:Protein nucleotidyltransferase YdiU n=1 Tax=Roseateles koreensis TaxID=2987526 RepID=A0ABT5KP24_9BURK|nr:YdiU family protein [Roseateles koreensis]MDC8784118.1 YdiU family protein [Roseateles koreensis]